MSWMILKKNIISVYSWEKGIMLYIGLCKVHSLHAYLQVCEIRLGFDTRNSVHFVFRACPIPGIRLAHLGISEYETLRTHDVEVYFSQEVGVWRQRLL